ncbi:Plasmodium exported protein (PHISTb), unknown function [Plasmodium reichenowi]|uniref:Plasmodium RESA N-terminal domain-containing protein n=1 Tax=Plasmodium reichenowi TaxID=5854 RepID=A0A2P9D6A8_PLARE|nr:Plasmodium exported protein (PHISTb), unknown function [Plasmodium reichenowi]
MKTYYYWEMNLKKPINYLDLWKRVVKNEESKLYLLKRNLYQQHLKLRNRSRLPHDKLNNILNECNVVVKKYNNNYDKTINDIFKEWSTVTPHNIFLNLKYL